MLLSLAVPHLKLSIKTVGLPQGSSLGPLKFVVYAADLHAMASRHIKLHSFADDTQLYKHTNIRDVPQAKQEMIAAVTAVNEWSQTRKLKRNPRKSEVTWLGTRQQLAKLSQADMTLQLPITIR